MSEILTLFLRFSVKIYLQCEFEKSLEVTSIGKPLSSRSSDRFTEDLFSSQIGTKPSQRTNCPNFSKSHKMYSFYDTIRLALP